MVNEVVDFHSETTAQQAQLQRSCSGFIIGQQQQHDQQQDLLTVSLNTRLLPNSAENLSWTFFEQVSSLDNQLRSDESSGIQANGSHLMTTSMHDVNTTTVDGQHQETITRITNGYAHTANKTDDTLSQQSPDLILKHQQQQPQQQQHAQYQPQQTHVTISNTATATTTSTTTSFKFTSPTATFKRKKQQLQQQLNQQQVSSSSSNNNNNSNKYDNNKCHTATAAATTTEHSQQQLPTLNAEQQQQIATTHNKSGNHCVVTPNTAATKATAAAVAFNGDNSKPQKQQQHRRHASNAMISNAAVINFDTTARAATTTTAAGRGIEHGAGSGNSRTQAKTRTLPTIASVYANDLDLLGDTKAIAAAADNRSTQQRMGATLPGGLAGASGGSGGGSSKASASHSFVDGIELHLGLVGWRKKCLYTLLALLMLLIITNLVLTLWILKVMEFSMEGMGPLKIVPGGVQLTGQALIMDMLRASTIRSRHGQPIAIESSRNFSINTRDSNGMLENHLFLGHDKLECLSTGFRINDTAGRNLFSVNRDEVTIGAHALRIDGEGGAIFRESIQTPHVRAEPGRELRLESPTRQLELTAAKDINLQSRAGGIELSALEDVKLSALDGSLRLESSKILMPNLRTAQPPIPGSAQSRDHLHRVFQLCACANGKLFLAAPHSICAGDDSTVCR